jgi:hypothetical protein
MNKRQLPFIALGIAAPGAFLLFYPIYRRSETAAWAFMICGVLFGLALFGWSLWSFRRQPGRAIIGLVICGYCFWQVLVIPGYVEAVKRHLTSKRSNKLLQATRDGRSSSAVAEDVISPACLSSER